MAKKANDDGLVEVFIPVDFSNPDETEEYVAVNGKAMLIPKGKTVRVKPEYAALVAISQEMKQAQYNKEVEARKAASKMFEKITY